MDPMGKRWGLMAKTVRVLVRRTYNWIDKDPVVDKCMALVKKRGLQGRYGRLGLLTGMSSSTFKAWDMGATKEPQHRRSRTHQSSRRQIRSCR